MEWGYKFAQYSMKNLLRPQAVIDRKDKYCDFVWSSGSSY